MDGDYKRCGDDVNSGDCDGSWEVVIVVMDEVGSGCCYYCNGCCFCWWW